MNPTAVTLTTAQARDLTRTLGGPFLPAETGTVEGLTFTAGPDAVAHLLARAAQLNPGPARTFLLVAAKIEAAIA